MFYYLFLCQTDKHKKKTIKKEERKEKQKKINEYILEKRLNNWTLYSLNEDELFAYFRPFSMS